MKKIHHMNGILISEKTPVIGEVVDTCFGKAEVIEFFKNENGNFIKLIFPDAQVDRKYSFQFVTDIVDIDQYDF